jgi:hypothetical protein
MSSWESLVEAVIDAVHVDLKNKKVRVELTCAWNDKDRLAIVASGVDDFLVNEMRLSNIVDRVSRFDADSIEAEDKTVARRLFLLMQGREPDASDLESPLLKEKLRCIQNGSLGLLEIEPVYGATILVLAENFKIEPLT